ncbi:cytochrome P450 [uncultured Algimonas sp.]|uniref:cytochrome P450 n=1 Tax=uncultured Algimonas sp. TaxID=1547920 RepID=UPI00261FD54D|nr:cytochrome P450 [uncultured Algimonas sp.]
MAAKQIATPDIASQVFLRDPAAGVLALQAQGPLVRIRLPLIGRAWVTTTHAATKDVLKRDEDFRMTKAGKRPAGLQWWMPRSVRLLADNMLGRDGDAHRRLRGKVDRAFAKRGIEALEPRVAAWADRLLGPLAERREIDLVADYARPFPADVIADLLGVGAARRDAFVARAAGFADTSTPMRTLSSVLGTGGFVRFVRAMVGEARKTPRDGLLRDLLSDDDPLGEAELVSMVFLLMFAGFETTTNLISGSVLALERNPAAKAAWLADPHPRGIEELVRHVSAVAGSKPRFAAREAVVQGITVPAGALVMALPIAANYDPAMFDAPKRLVLDRLPNPHLGFGAGPHFCLGNQLARLELRVALQRLYARFPDLRLTDDRPAYHERAGHRALKSLPVRLAA